MKNSWLKPTLPIAAIFSFRMLGLFLLIPVFTAYASHFQAATPALIGIALGSYGLSQGLLQIPFGMLSDKFGRKPVICIGLILFAIGSLVGALSHSIYGIIIARTLQGTGAIGSVLIALLADLTSEEQRTKAMAVIGMSIGLSFSLAMVISPLIITHYELPGIFYLTALFAILGIMLLYLVIPSPAHNPFKKTSVIRTSVLKSIIKDTRLMPLNAGIFIQHAILTSTFYVVPLIIKQQNISSSSHFYLPLIVGSFLSMVPFIIYAERKKRVKPVFLGAVLVTFISQCVLSFNAQNWPTLCAMMFFYFVAFNLLEATLPSLISKQANTNHKGTAMGVYSSCQFLGIFFGGFFAGFVFKQYGSAGIFSVNATLACIWFLISMKIKPYHYNQTHPITYQGTLKNEPELINQLLALPGINKAIVSPEKQTIFLSINKENYQNESGEKRIDLHMHTYGQSD